MNLLIKKIRFLIRWREFKRQYKLFNEQTVLRNRNMPLRWDDRYPCLEDATESTGFDRHYIYHPAWAARVLAKTRPLKHVDVSSTLHFSTLVSAFVPVDFFDFRPAQLTLSGFKSMSANLTNLSWPSATVESLSCMHVIEHIGLGRYGDPINPNGDLLAIAELIRVLKPGGDLLVAVPVGRERVCFNAHRVYNAKRFSSYFDGLELMEFSLIPDGDVPDGMLTEYAMSTADEQYYGCGCYWFRKPFGDKSHESDS